MMRIADGEQCDAVGPRLGHQRIACGGESRQGEAIIAVDAQKTGSDIFEHRLGAAIDPAALQRAEIAGDAKDAVAA
jgi:hypothetical protein